MLATCPHCGWSDVVGDEFLGQTAECPSCENDFVVQDAEAIVEASPQNKKLKVAAKKKTGVSTTRKSPQRSKTLMQHLQQQTLLMLMTKSISIMEE